MDLVLRYSEDTQSVCLQRGLLGKCLTDTCLKVAKCCEKKSQNQYNYQKDYYIVYTCNFKMYNTAVKS